MRDMLHEMGLGLKRFWALSWWWKGPTLAAAGAGADGLIIEVHPDPDHALSDGPQSLTPENFSRLMQRVGAVAAAAGRPLHEA